MNIFCKELFNGFCRVNGVQATFDQISPGEALQFVSFCLIGLKLLKILSSCQELWKFI